LTLLNARAFVKVHAGYPPGDLGGDGRAAARRDIAAGVQQSFAAAGADRFVHRRDFDERLLIPEGVHPACDTGKDDQASKENRETFADLAAFALTFVDSQRA
jgi:hypothetical protein